MKLPIYNFKGEKTKDKEVPAKIFGLKANPAVVHQVVVAQLANARAAVAHTKDRGDVAGGGKKPWRQKGTGRARHGSIRSPLWRGGGVTFGPTSERNFSRRVNRKQKQLALAMCLSDKVADQKLIVLESLSLADGKTKELKNLLADLTKSFSALAATKSFLIVLPAKDEKMVRASMNLQSINTIKADSLNCVDILKYGAIIVPEKSVDVIVNHYRQISDKREKNS